MIQRLVIALAALSGPLPKAGVIVVALLVALVILAPDRRVRALAMLGALILSPVLLLSEIWRSPQLGIVHRHPDRVAVGTVEGARHSGATGRDRRGDRDLGGISVPREAN